MRTLLVDDSPLSRQIFQRHLRDCSECDLATNGREGLEAFTRNLEEQRPYDLVCLDLQMPELDGLQLLRLIREREASTSTVTRVKILVITATADAEVVKEVMAEGADGYLLKPVSPQKLRDYMINLGLVTVLSQVKIDQIIKEVGELCDADALSSAELTGLIRRMAGSIERQALRERRPIPFQEGAGESA